MGTSIGELFVSLGFDVDDKKLKDFNDSLHSTADSMLRLAGISLSVAGFAAMIDHAATAAVKMSNYSAELGINQRAMESWANAANQINPAIDVAGFEDRYAKFTQILKDASQGKGPTGALARLMEGGYHPGMSTDEGLAAIAANKEHFLATNGSNPQEAKAIFSGLLDEAGLGAGSTKTFDHTIEEMKAMGDAMVISKQAKDALVGLSSATAKLEQQFNKMYGELSGEAAPYLTRKIESVGNLFEHIGNGDGWKYYKESIFPDSAVSLMAHSASQWLSDQYDEAEREKHPGDLQYGKATSEEKAGTKETAEKFFMTSMQLTAAQASGLVGRLIDESGLKTGAVGDSGLAKGIAQWHPDRQAIFKKIMGRDLEGSTFEQQLEFIKYEMTQGNEQRAGRLIRRASNRDEAYGYAKADYERAGGTHLSMTNNVTQNIHSTAPARQVADESQRLIQSQQNAAMAQINLGQVR